MKLNDFRRILRENVKLPEPRDAGFVERAKELVPVPGPAPRGKRLLARFAALSGSFALVVTGFVFLVLGTTPAASVSLDINPSVRLDLNRFGYVIDVEGTNDDGILLVADLEKTRGSLPKVLSGILGSAVSLGYAEDGETDMLFGISGTSYETEQALEIKILSVLPQESTEAMFLNLHTDADSDLREGLVIATETDFWSAVGFVRESETSVTSTTAVYDPADYYDSAIPEWSMIDGKFVTIFPANDAVGEVATGGIGSETKTVYSGLTPAAFSALADSLGVSETKLNLAILVFQGYPSYILPSDLAYLCTLSVGDLMDLYDALA